MTIPHDGPIMLTVIKKTAAAAIQDITDTVQVPDMSRRGWAVLAQGISQDSSHQTAAAVGMNLAAQGWIQPFPDIIPPRWRDLNPRPVVRLIQDMSQVVMEQLHQDLNQAAPAAAGSSLASQGMILESPGFRAVKLE